MDVTDTHLDGICEECILSKMDEKPFKNREDRDSQLFGTLHANLIGPMNPEARWPHAKFSLVINDDCSGFGFVFNLKHKDRAAKSIMDLDKAIEAKFHKRTHTLKTDNSGEFVNSTLQKHCQERGITSMTSVAYNPELNGRAERRNQTHIEGAWTMIKYLKLGKDLWGEAMSTHIYIRNRCLSSILPDNITPYEKVFNQPLSINHLRVFGSKCFIKVPDKMRSMLDDKERECRLIGLEGKSIYIVVDAEKRKLRSQNIIFVEGTSNRHNKNRPPPLELATMEHTPDGESEDAQKKQTRSKVWGTNPT